MSEIGYKVVRVLPDGRLVSATRCGREVEYGIGVDASPPPGCGPLGIFPQLRHAIDFRDSQSAPGSVLRVYRCRYVWSSALEMWYEQQPNGVGRFIEIGDLWPGTVLADRVTLCRLDEVETDD